jgi:hypothetical protein
MTPPTTLDAESDASAKPSMAPSAAACAPIVERKPGSAAVAISWPVSDSRLPSPIPTTLRLRSTCSVPNSTGGAWSGGPSGNPSNLLIVVDPASSRGRYDDERIAIGPGCIDGESLATDSVV